MKKFVLITCFTFSMQAIFAQMDNKKDIELIQSLRAASNEAIAKHDINKLSAYWLDDVVIIRGNSTHLWGKDTIVAEWKKLFQNNPQVLYVRTPKEIVISNNDSLAWETGTWTAVNSYSKGGNYSAMWKKLNNTWKIQAELFVSLF